MSSHTSETKLAFLGKLIVETEAVCETGLHIGAGKGTLEIGGADSAVVKDSFGRPYIPGSSLRGAMRHQLEVATGALEREDEMVYLSRRRGQEVRIHQSNRPDDEICLLFGGPNGRGRLTVSDAALVEDSITAQMRENLDGELTEVKSEVAIDRLTAQASPRTMERVPAGAKFKVRLTLDVLCKEDADLIALLPLALRLIEDSGLGGGRSRGSGRVTFGAPQTSWRSKDAYLSGAEAKALEKLDAETLLAEIG